MTTARECGGRAKQTAMHEPSVQGEGSRRRTPNEGSHKRSTALETQVQTQQTAADARQPAAPTPMHKQQKALLVPILALLVIAFILFAVLLLVRGNGAHKTALPPVGTAAAVSESQLKTLARQSNQPIYWAGPKPGAYELTRTNDGRIYIRYLPSSDKLGDRTPSYLTVGTYPTKQAFLGVKRAAARQGGVSVKIEHGGLLVFNAGSPKSVYFSYPKRGYQVEVYDPSPQQARTLVLGGKITPVK